MRNREFLTRVRDIENNKIGEVIDTLAVQFTAAFDDKIKFFFYNDKGSTWEPLNEEDLPNEQEQE